MPGPTEDPPPHAHTLSSSEAGSGREATTRGAPRVGGVRGGASAGLGGDCRDASRDADEEPPDGSAPPVGLVPFLDAQPAFLLEPHPGFGLENAEAAAALLTVPLGRRRCPWPGADSAAAGPSAPGPGGDPARAVPAQPVQESVEQRSGPPGRPTKPAAGAR